MPLRGTSLEKSKAGRVGRQDRGEGREKAGRWGRTAESWTGQTVLVVVTVSILRPWRPPESHKARSLSTTLN